MTGNETKRSETKRNETKENNNLDRSSIISPLANFFFQMYKDIKFCECKCEWIYIIYLYARVCVCGVRRGSHIIVPFVLLEKVMVSEYHHEHS
jgi:hypothetical protein